MVVAERKGAVHVEDCVAISVSEVVTLGELKVQEVQGLKEHLRVRIYMKLMLINVLTEALDEASTLVAASA